MAQSMSSAPFVWHSDGRPDWGSMWTTFCELALYGGPPPRRAPRAAPARPRRGAGGGGPRARGGDGGRGRDGTLRAEMRRGIWETTGLYAESAEPGWLAITCDSPTMAAWMC